MSRLETNGAPLQTRNELASPAFHVGRRRGRFAAPGGLSRENARAASRRGTALFSTLVVCMGLLGLLYATVVMSAVEVKESRLTVDQVRTRYLAESGFERGLHFLDDAVTKRNAADPLGTIAELFGGGVALTPFVGERILHDGAAVGAFSVTMTLTNVSDTSLTIDIQSTGYLPDAPVNLGSLQAVEAWESLSVTVQLSLEPSEVFNYAYFINNWGWFYGSTIIANGNVRSNGQFDAAGYKPTVTGQPLYDSIDFTTGSADLVGYEDDNGDGLQDGNDGGIFSGWDIVGAQNVRGNGGDAENQHDFTGQIEMPNLSNLSHYEDKATTAGSSISISGSKVSDGVYGDDPTERKNLYLMGTAADPIELDGPIVVQGDVIIGGYVTGQGAIYAEGNIYCPDSVIYVDPPTTTRPSDNTEAATEAWLDANWDKDFLGLFARENVVIGDHTSSTWQFYVKQWMASSLNKSEEDAGSDGIPNTVAGMDGVLGTADDDTLEDDGVFTVDTYTEDDEALGLIPPGFQVGDNVPGTGEDIDGDGLYDDTITLSEIEIDDHLDHGLWGGNMPVAGIHDYSDIATLYANQLDAVFYTNHTFAYVVLGGTPAEINGAIVSRNEDIVYGTPTITINYDCRLLGGVTGMAGDLLPQVVAPPRVVRWVKNDEDPNRYVGMALDLEP